MERKIVYVYDKLRKSFGKQPLFYATKPEMVDSINPNRQDEIKYGLRNPVNTATQVTAPFSEHEANTITAEMRNTCINHSEGGWPKDIHWNVEEETIRYRRRIEREDNYVHAVMKLAPRLEYFIKQNNSINLYEQYFKGMNEEISFEKPNVMLNNVFRDDDSRPVASLCWTIEDDTKLAVSYCDKTYPVHGPINTNFTCCVWDLDSPHTPASEFRPPTACWSIACSPTDPTVIVGGLDDGRVCIFDLRVQKETISESPAHTAHRDPVSAILYITSRQNNQFFTGSSDGLCLWHDLRDLSAPIEFLFMSAKVPPGHIASFPNAEGVSALHFERSLPTRFLCGTDTGMVLNVNRKGKTHSDIISAVYNAQYGPVRAVHRSPCSSKVFLTCGDWRVNIWAEDVRTSPIITGVNHRYQIMDAAWAPQKVSAYMTVSDNGEFCYWNLLRRYGKSVINKKLSNNGLLKVVPHENGRFVAVGDKKGSLYLLSLSPDLVSLRGNDKQLMAQIFERECKREHILANRVKEIRLKMKEEEEENEAHSGEELSADAQLRIVEDEYRRQVIEEVRRGGNLSSHHHDSMRKR